MSTFEKKSTMPVGADELYRWHARPGAFERLVPPWDPVDLVSHEGGIEDGARRVMKIHPGPLSLTWEALHRDHIEGRQFVDEQLRGPFSSWVHTHRFEPREDSETSILSEHIEYSLPLGPLGDAVGGASTRKMLEQLFDFRHRRTADDLNRHRTTDRHLKVAITGASGLIGSALSAFLTTGGHEVLRLVRRPDGLEEGEVYWSPAKQEIDAESLEGLDDVLGDVVGRPTVIPVPQTLIKFMVGSQMAQETALVSQRALPRKLLDAGFPFYYDDLRSSLACKLGTSSGRP